MGAKLDTTHQAFFVDRCSEGRAPATANSTPVGVVSVICHSQSSQSSQKPGAQPVGTAEPTVTGSAGISFDSSASESSASGSLGSECYHSPPEEKFCDIASFLRATGHVIVQLKERMIAGGLNCNLQAQRGEGIDFSRGEQEAAWTLFERAYDACEKVFCEDNEGLSKARVLGRLLDPKSTWDFILVAHPERLSIATGYVIHTGEFCGTRFSIAEYVWVDPEYRRSGLGGCFVDYMMQELRTRGIDLHFGEIKDPYLDTYTRLSPAQSCQGGFNPLHQFSFWQKQGRLLVDTVWPQPALLAGDKESFAEQLTALPLNGKSMTLSPDLILAVWDAKYGVDNWKASEAETLGILQTRAKLEVWLRAFTADCGEVRLRPLDRVRWWTIEQFSSNH